MAIKDKGRKQIEKKNRVLGTLKIEYVGVDSIKPNAYNPNRQSEHDFELLLRSMAEDGFTQPIIVQGETRTIVDGEHRWMAARQLGYKEIPVVLVNMTPEQMRIATLRHNRARGSEDIELTAQVLRDLQALGALEWAQDSLMLDDTEINRLLEDVAAPEALAAEQYSDAWQPDTVGSSPDMAQSTQGVEYGQPGDMVVTGMTQAAIDTTRQREKALRAAKTEEEQTMIRKEKSLYRIALIFSGDEADIVKSVLGNTPAETLVRLCREQQARQAQ